MNRWLLAAIFGAFLLAVGMLVIGPEREVPAAHGPMDMEPRSEAGPPQIAPLSPQPQQVQAVPPKEPAAPPAPAPSQLPPAPEGEPEVAVEAEATDLEAYVPQRSEGVDAFKRAYENDSADADASTVERQVLDILREVQVPDEIVQSVNCHRRVCRLRMLWSQTEPMKMMAVHMGLGTRFSPLIQTEPLGEVEDGEATVDVYVLRPGVQVEDVQ